MGWECRYTRPDVDCLVKVLQLQHTRCEVYRKWDAKFHSALAGVLSLVDFQSILGNTILPTFQEVSSSLRQLQDAHRETGGVQNEFLVSWIQQVQHVEQEHYRTSVELMQLIAEHCTFVSPPDKTQVDAVGAVSNDAQVRDELKAVSTASEEKCAPPVAISNACANVHDLEHCALRRLVPTSCQTAATFVSCRDTTLHCSEDEEEDEEISKWHNGENSDRVTLVFRSEVRRRCADFNTAVLPLWHKKRELQQKLHEQMEELQEELANSTASE